MVLTLRGAVLGLDGTAVAVAAIGAAAGVLAALVELLAARPYRRRVRTRRHTPSQEQKGPRP